MQKARSDRGKHRKASAAEQARLKEIEAFEFDGKDGVSKHVPGLEATLLGRGEKEKVLSVSKVVWRVHIRVEANERQYIPDSLGVAGVFLATSDTTSHVKGMGPSSAVFLGRCVVQNPEKHTNEVQPSAPPRFQTSIRSMYREKCEGYAAFLGSGITAKVSFHESQNKNFVNKAEYGKSGPPAIIGVSPALL